MNKHDLVYLVDIIWYIFEALIEKSRTIQPQIRQKCMDFSRFLCRKIVGFLTWIVDYSRLQQIVD